jgi:predicted enzyme related to lactoylglutathione lyase
MANNDVDQSALIQGRTFEWHELNTPDVEASVAFYTETLGFGSTQMEMGEMGTYTMLTREGRPVCGVTKVGDQVPPHWGIYLSVDDVDTRVAAAEANGSTILSPGFDVPTVGRMALIQDPEGARLWLFKAEHPPL